MKKELGVEDWQLIGDSDTLKIYFDYTDASRKNLIGMYGYYNPADLLIDLDSIGHVQMSENDISFVYPLSLNADRDTTTFPLELIQNETDTLMVIGNTYNTTTTEVKYKRVGLERIRIIRTQ